MKKYAFRLAQVQRVREAQEEKARAEVILARRAEQEADALVRSRTASYRAMLGPVGCLPQVVYRGQRQGHVWAAEAVEAAEARRVEARELLAQRVAEWSAAKQKVTALERLDERRRAEWVIEAQHEEDKLVDDLVTGRFARKGAGAGVSPGAGT